MKQTEIEIAAVISQISGYYPNLEPEELRKLAIASISAVNSVWDGLERTLQEGANITITPNRTAKTFTIASTGGGGGGDIESVTGNIVSNTDPANPVVTQENADWNSVAGVSKILNKPTIPTLSGHQIIDENDNPMTQRAKMQVKGNLVTASDNGSDTSIFTIADPDLTYVRSGIARLTWQNFGLTI